MKTTVIFSEDVIAQIVLTPESDADRIATNLIQDGHFIGVAVNGNFTDSAFGSGLEPYYTKKIAMCQGEYLRAFDHASSKILVIKQYTPDPQLKEMEEELKNLRHFRDSSVGLWCIDRNPEEVSSKWIRENAFQLEDKLVEESES